MALAVLIHLAVSTLAAIFMGLAFGRINANIAVVSLLLGTIAGVWVWRNLKDEGSLFPNIKFTQVLFYGFILFAALQHFLYLLYYDRHALKTLHLNNFGDLTMHIQYIRSIALGSHFWPENPGFAGDLLRYPIGMDLYNALLETLGVPTDSHLFLVGIIMTLAAVSMLHRWMGWLGVGAFFLNGGIANWQCLREGRLFDFQNTVAWKNFFLSLWITQRGFLFAIPAGVYVIKTITETILGERTLNRKEKIVCVILWSALAWFHLHTFFILSLTLGICILLYGRFRLLLEIALPVAAAGCIFVWFSTDGLSRAKILHTQWGWVAGEENLLKFWFVNLGPWLLLSFAGIFLILKKSHAHLRPFAVVFYLLFLVFTWVMVAPWDWDNTKVLIWLYLLIVWISWRTWVKHLSPVFAFLTGCILFFSGTLAVVSSLPGNSQGVQLYKAEEVWESKAALMDLPKDAVLAVVPDPNHPAMFWGANVAMGYPGHLWTHAIDYAERERQLERIFKGESDWIALAGDIGITHIYWGANERRKYDTFNPSWQYQLKNISRSHTIKVFEVHPIRSYE